MANNWQIGKEYVPEAPCHLTVSAFYTTNLSPQHQNFNEPFKQKGSDI